MYLIMFILQILPRTVYHVIDDNNNDVNKTIKDDNKTIKNVFDLNVFDLSSPLF